MSRYLDPKADVVFKKIFGDHPHLLKSFLNAVLPLAVNNPIVELLDIPEISEAVGLAEEAAYTPGELSAYETYWDNVRTEKTLLLGRYEEGEAAGRIKEKKDMAKKMIKRGVAIEIVAEDTGLTQDDVKRIKAHLQHGL